MKGKRLWNCLCGVSFVGTKKQIEQHLESVCPVYLGARNNLIVDQAMKSPKLVI
jgi:hypothetical protein